MRFLLFVFCLSAPCLLLASKNQNNDSLIYDFCEVEPNFTGGDAAMSQFIQKNIRFPEEVINYGTVYVKFIVEKDGTLSEITLTNNTDQAWYDEIVRIFDLMPPWQPGSNDGEPVRCRYILPICIYPR